MILMVIARTYNYTLSKVKQFESTGQIHLKVKNEQSKNNSKKSLVGSGSEIVYRNRARTPYKRRLLTQMDCYIRGIPFEFYKQISGRTLL